MATTYDTTAADAEMAIKGSTLPQDVQGAILGLLDSLPPNENLTVVNNFLPGDSIPGGTDIILVDENASGPVALPTGVPIVIFEGGHDVQVSIDGSIPTIVSLGSGNDSFVVQGGVDSQTVFGGAGNDTITGAGGTDSILGAEGDDFLQSGDGNDTLAGGSGHNSIVGGAGDNIFMISDGSDTIQGGGGFDEAVIDRSRADFDVHWEGSETIITDLSGHTSVLENTEFIGFDGGAIINASNDDLGIIARMYEAAFDRTGDHLGVKFWFDVYESGEANLTQIAESFLNSNEFLSSHDDLSNEQFVDLLYENLFGRAPDAEGFTFWTSLLDQGSVTRADLVVSFAASVEGEEKTAGTIHVIHDEG